MTHRLALALPVFALALASPLQAEITRADGLANGPVPILACAANNDTGCAEIILSADTPEEFAGLVPCFSVPPFGDAGIAIETDLVTIGPKTRSFRVELAPLSAVVAGSYPLTFGHVDQPSGKIACTFNLTLERKAGTLAAPASLVLPERRVGLFWGEDFREPTVIKIAPAAGSVAIGPLSLSPSVQLVTSEGAQSSIAVDLDTDGRIQAGQSADLTIAATGKAALGTLRGELVLSAPQLTSPVRIPVEMKVRIGVFSTLAVLLLGIFAGWLVRTRLIPERDLASARLVAARAREWAEMRLASETDPDLVQACGERLSAMARQVAIATAPAAIEAAAAALQSEVEQMLSEASAARKAMADTIAPLVTAFTPDFGKTELPKVELNVLRDLLRDIESALANRQIALPRAKIDRDLPQVRENARLALRAFAEQADTSLKGLSRWTEGEIAPQLAPLVALAPVFISARDLPVEQAISIPRPAWFDLAAAATRAAPVLDRVLRGLAIGSAGIAALQPKGNQLTKDILATITTTPIRAAAQMAELHALYLAAAGGKPFSEAFTAKPGAVEAGPVGGFESLNPMEVVRPSETTHLSLAFPLGLPVAGRPFEILVTGQNQGENVEIATPVNAIRLSSDGRGERLRAIADAPGALDIIVRVASANGAHFGEQRFALTVEAGPAEQRIHALLVEKKRLDRLAMGAAGALSLLSGLWIFETVPLTNWWALLAPALWGFYANLNLTEAIERLQGQRTALFDALKVA